MCHLTAPNIELATLCTTLLPTAPAVLFTHDPHGHHVQHAFKRQAALGQLCAMISTGNSTLKSSRACSSVSTISCINCSVVTKNEPYTPPFFKCSDSRFSYNSLRDELPSSSTPRYSLSETSRIAERYLGVPAL